MAQNDVFFFEEAWARIHEDINLETDEFYMALMTSTETPVASAADPRYGAGGTTDYSTNEPTQNGNYTTGGETLGAATLTEVDGNITFTTPTDANWLKDAVNNPPDVKWGLIYDWTMTEKYAIAYVDLGTLFDMRTGDLNIAAPGAGWFTETDA